MSIHAMHDPWCWPGYPAAPEYMSIDCNGVRAQPKYWNASLDRTWNQVLGYV